MAWLVKLLPLIIQYLPQLIAIISALLGVVNTTTASRSASASFGNVARDAYVWGPFAAALVSLLFAPTTGTMAEDHKLVQAVRDQMHGASDDEISAMLRGQMAQRQMSRCSGIKPNPGA